MTKLLLAISTIASIVILYYFSDFTNSGIAYILLFCSLSVATFCIVKLKYPSDEKDEYAEVEKENDRLEQLDGIFTYHDSGFSFMKDHKTEFVCWDDILEVNSYNIPIFRGTTQSGLQVVTKNNCYDFDDHPNQGLEKLTNQLINNLPDWRLDQPTEVINGQGTTKTNLFKRNA